MRKYLSFDIEIACTKLEKDSDWDEHRPLGITCIALAWGDQTRTYAAPGDRMDPSQVDEVVANLRTATERGYAITAWNGLSFDLRTLAEECSEENAAWLKRIAMSEHFVDPMFHFLCEKGWPCGVQSACEGIGLSKTDGMSGALAPLLWDAKWVPDNDRNVRLGPDGLRSPVQLAEDRQRVVDYCENDAVVQLQVTERAERDGTFRWVTKAGKARKMALREWRDTKTCLLFEQPDTSWMDDPGKWARERFYAWTGFEAGVF